MEQTSSEWHKENHDFIMDFLNQTEADTQDLTLSIKATICQFLQNTRYGLHLCAKQNGGQWVSRKQVIEVQIEQLRRCIVDLQKCLNNKEVIQ
jgi:hypothetical protein